MIKVCFEEFDDYEDGYSYKKTKYFKDADFQSICDYLIENQDCRIISYIKDNSCSCKICGKELSFDELYTEFGEYFCKKCMC